MTNHIGTITTSPRVAVYLGEEGLELRAETLISLIPSTAVLPLIDDLSKLVHSKQEGVRIDGIPIPWNKVKTTINILLRGLDKLGVDTSEFKRRQFQNEIAEWERGEGMVPEKAEPIDGAGI